MIEIKNAIQEVEKVVEEHWTGIERSVELVRSFRASDIRRSKEQGTYRDFLQAHADAIDYHHYHLQISLEILEILKKHDNEKGENINLSVTTV